MSGSFPVSYLWNLRDEPGSTVEGPGSGEHGTGHTWIKGATLGHLCPEDTTVLCPDSGLTQRCVCILAGRMGVIKEGETLH